MTIARRNEGKQWTDRYIAKMCHVSNMTVIRIVDSLEQSASETRPTLRRYIDKHGNLSWMETAKINEPDEPDEGIRSTCNSYK